jgi:hypothetical protein
VRLPTALAFSFVVVLAGCGDGDDGGDAAPAGTLNVAEALTVEDGTEVTVAGHLIALPDGTAELCGGPIQESAPPGCGVPALPVDGLDDPASVPGASEVGTWVEGDVELTGVVQGGRLQVP